MTEFIGYSVTAFLAGMLLNVMPCVLPVIPFKIQAIIREIEGDIRSRVFAAMSLLLGSFSFFLVLGGVTAYMGLTWGALFQSKLFLQSLRQKDFALFESRYAAFSTSNDDVELQLLVDYAHKSADRFNVGSVAPNLELISEKGKLVIRKSLLFAEAQEFIIQSRESSLADFSFCFNNLV